MTEYRREISASVLRNLLNQSSDREHHLPDGVDIRDVTLGALDPAPGEGHYVVLVFTDKP